MTEPKTILDPAQAKMDKAIEFLVEALASVRAGKASTNLLNGITVDYYGNPTPVSQVASVTVPDARTVLIQPWEKNLIGAIEKAILVANIGLTPSNNGEHIQESPKRGHAGRYGQRRRRLVPETHGQVHEKSGRAVRGQRGRDHDRLNPVSRRRREPNTPERCNNSGNMP